MLVEPRHCQALHWAWGVRSQNLVAQQPWSGSAQVPCAVSIQLSSVQPWAWYLLTSYFCILSLLLCIYPIISQLLIFIAKYYYFIQFLQGW